MGLLTREIIKKYVVECASIQLPKKDELVIFKFPPSTPTFLIVAFEQRLVEFQNSERKFITTNLEVEFVKTKKDALEVQDGKEKNKNKKTST